MKLTKSQIDRRARLVASLQSEAAVILARIEALNGAIDEHSDAILGAAAKYNDLLSEVRDLVAEIEAQAEDYIEDKSSTWQDSDKGQAALAWKDEWSCLDLTDIEPDLPPEMDEPILSHADDLEVIAEGPSS